MYGDENVYVYTDGIGGLSDDGKNLFTVIDAATGEIKEHYNFGSGRAAGPFLDEATGKVLIYYVDDGAAVYMRDVE